MTVMNVVRRAALPAAAGLAISALAAAVPAAQAAPPALHVAATIGLGRLGGAFTYKFSQAPDGDVFYFRGADVYVVKQNAGPAVALHASGPVLAVAANSADMFVEVGQKISAYRRDTGQFVRSWRVPKSLAPLTEAGLYAVGSTVWAWTDWATDESGLEYANVYRFSTSSPVVHTVSTNIAYPADMAADSTGLYYEADGLIHVSPSGSVRRRSGVSQGAPMALAAGNVYVLAQHSNGTYYLDAFTAPGLAAKFSAPVAGTATDIAGTGAGLLLLAGDHVSTLSTASGLPGTSISVPDAVTLVPGHSAVVITTAGNYGQTSLVRLAG
jgi:hypothetical protein